MPDVVLRTGEATVNDIALFEFVGDAVVITAVPTDVTLSVLGQSLDITVSTAVVTVVIVDLILYTGEAVTSDVMLRAFGTLIVSTGEVAWHIVWIQDDF